MKYCFLLISTALLLSCRKQVFVPYGFKSLDTTAAAALSFSAGSNDEPLDGKILLKQLSNARYTSRNWQGIPTIVSDVKDNLVAAWYSGGSGEGPGNYITLSVSKDHGRTWKNNEAIISPKAGSNVRYFDPVLWRDPSGNIYCFWNKVTSPTLWDGRGGVWYSKIRYENDSLLFDTPKRIADGVMLNKPLAIKNNSEILFSISMWTWAPALSTRTGAFIYKADFASKSNFEELSVIPAKSGLGNHFEHMVANVSSSKLLALTRTDNDAIQYSQSGNNGYSWDTVKKFTAVGKTTASRFFIERLKSGHLLLILNNSADRSNLSVFLSVNSGATWRYKLVLANASQKAVSYPDATQTKDGVIHIVSDMDRFGTGEINYVSLTESDIIKGKLSANSQKVIAKK